MTKTPPKWLPTAVPAHPVSTATCPICREGMRWREWMLRAEAAIFAAPRPVARETLAGLVGDACRLDALIADINDELKARPYEIVFVAGG